jgi:hypothetical protein
MSNDSPPTFVLVLRPLPHGDAYRALRMALKFLLRRFGLRAVKIGEGRNQCRYWG